MAHSSLSYCSFVSRSPIPHNVTIWFRPVDDGKWVYQRNFWKDHTRNHSTANSFISPNTAVWKTQTSHTVRFEITATLQIEILFTASPYQKNINTATPQIPMSPSLSHRIISIKLQLMLRLCAKGNLLYFLLILSWNRSTCRLLFVPFLLHFFHLVLLALDFYLVCNRTIYDFQSMLCCHLKIRSCRCAFISPPILKDFLISSPPYRLDFKPHLASRHIYILWSWAMSETGELSQ